MLFVAGSNPAFWVLAAPTIGSALAQSRAAWRLRSVAARRIRVAPELRAVLSVEYRGTAT